MGIVPRDGIGKPRYKLPLYRFFHDYYGAATEFVNTQSPSSSELSSWSERYFQIPSKGSCTFEAQTGYSEAGHNFEANSRKECCNLCSEDPTCQVGVFLNQKCYMKFGIAGKQAGN